MNALPNAGIGKEDVKTHVDSMKQKMDEDHRDQISIGKLYFRIFC